MSYSKPQTMDKQVRQTVGAALGKMPSGLFILTARHEDRRLGMLTSWVQQTCFEPPMVSIAVAKGRGIMPLISESHRFALCQLAEGDQINRRKFAHDPALGEDPFLGLETLADPCGGPPILAQAAAYLVCELTCHLDVEGDHDLFVGQVLSAGCGAQSPAIHLREDGFRY